MPGERKPGQDNPYYDWSPITKRKPLRWPKNARVALVVILNLEHYDWELPPDAPNAPRGPFRPNVAGWGQREYGNRVGVFRILHVLDKHGIKPTIAMDRVIAETNPFLVHECQKRNLEVIAHGATARQPIYAAMTPEAEQTYISESIAAVTKAIGKKPAGWLGPDQQESMRTPAVLAAEGIRYVCDWANDEQPYRMKVPQGELFSLGVDDNLDDVYTHESGRRTIDEYRQLIEDTFDGLYRDGAANGRLMVINLHPWVIGWPWRIKYLDGALAHINKKGDIWKASGTEVIDWYKANA
jgi:peptidoglycan/xylan/chitin deacetylase (PgdA/CDA1 family)